MKRLLSTSLLVAAAIATQAQVSIDIDAQNRGPMISPTHYGIFFEDINHAADGGLYAELIRNRSFEDSKQYKLPTEPDGWIASGKLPNQLVARLIEPSKQTPLLNKAQHHALQLTIDATADRPARLINEGFWGINAVQGRSYRLSLWVKGHYKGTVKARLFYGDDVLAETDITPGEALGKRGMQLKEWTKWTAELTAEASNPKAKFELVFDGKGTLQLDVVSLFPPTFKNRDNGMRPDLASMLAEMHPKFMRFPGGCFVEGQDSPDNAFRWERTIGPIEEREGHWNVNWGYRTSDGMGFHEDLQLAEDLGAKPLYVVNVGIWHGGQTPLDSLQPWIDETLNALEYANGPVTSRYGALRAKNGHPAPFNIEYLEIGNENNQPDQRQQSDHYYERYDCFRKAILARYPTMKLIGNVAAWGTDHPKWESQLPVDLLDEHYYRTPGWFAEAFHKYDSYDRRGPKIYVGEYAVTNGFGNLGNMHAALGEAVYMMGMENNSDVVPLNSYAPIFVNENDAKWRPDMIRFNAHQVMGTPSYYVQMLMPRHLGKQVVRLEQTNPYDRQNSSVTPRQSRAGFATWATRATFKGGVGETEADFLSGEWRKNSDGSFAQTSMEERCIAIDRQIINGDHYTVKYRARKDSGNEGFLIVFNYVDPQNFCWLNLGGWDNTQHGIEQTIAGSKGQTATKSGKIETGRWYDITLQVEGDHVRAWLDQELVFDTQLRSDQTKGIFSSATIDDEAGELIVKIVNTGAVATTANLSLKHFTPREARVIRLAANSGDEENSLDNPTNISPREQQLSPDCDRVQLDVPAYSLNIVRIKK